MYTIYSNGRKYCTKATLQAALGVAWCLEQDGKRIKIINDELTEVYKS